MTEIIYRDNFPELIRPKVEKILADFNWLLPPWLQSLYVSYEGANEDASAHMRVDKSYRFADLTVCGHWANEKPGTQVEQIIHELIHIHFAPLKNYAVDVVEKVCAADNPLFDVVRCELTAKNEQGTQDLAFAIFNKFNG